MHAGAKPSRSWDLEVEQGRAVPVDFRVSPRPQRKDEEPRPGGLRFLFDCGAFNNKRLEGITLQADEIDEHRIVEMDEALALLSGPLRRRVSKGAGAKGCIYLEDGRLVPGRQRNQIGLGSRDRRRGPPDPGGDRRPAGRESAPRLPLPEPDELHRLQPTDVMPLRHWAKLTMGVQALISLVVLGLIIARAVNILTDTSPPAFGQRATWSRVATIARGQEKEFPVMTSTAK